MSIQNPIAKSHVNEQTITTDGEIYELERRVQVILNAWLKFYFNSTPFDTQAGLDGNGDPILRSLTFDTVELYFNQTTPTQPSNLTAIHITQGNTTEEECPTGLKNNQRWTKTTHTHNIFVKTPTRDDNDTSDRDAENRRIASQLKWLITSTEKQALGELGIRHIRVNRGPNVVSNIPHYVRQLSITFETLTTKEWNV